MSHTEAPQPPRGQTLDEQREHLLTIAPPVADAGEVRKFLRLLHPRELTALGNGLPVVVKQLVQALFLLVWPFWAVAVLCYGVIFYGVVYPVLWVLFWPVRMLVRRSETDTPDPTGQV